MNFGSILVVWEYLRDAELGYKIDQLSKLTGTTVVCLSIAFLMPSLAINGETESITNMIALSLFFVTIAVNVCIQIYTGVIFLFIVEHIMILCCMVVMLLSVLWAFSTVMSYPEKSAVVEALLGAVCASCIVRYEKQPFFDLSLLSPIPPPQAPGPSLPGEPDYSYEALVQSA
ncbi:hypothetical protein Sjap_025716 [Stephania japonica]|uniref:Uncharacterized protein n=1 Tax=Stephania japonica TaxID=461633 RepID=A0AAP0HJT6_9MAGN